MIDLTIQRKYAQYILGVMFSLITIFVMNNNIMVGEGRFFDFRHITMTMAGFIGGPVTAVIAAAMSSLYRYNVGGTGSMGGISNILVFACFGSILGRRVKSSQNGKRVVFWIIIGLIMACILLFIIAVIALWNGSSVAVLMILAGPFIICTPLVTTIIFNYYFWIYEFLSKASILNNIINFSPINLMIFDANGPILLSKNFKMQRQLYPYIENPALLVSSDNTCLNTTNQQARKITTEDGRRLVADLSSFQMPSGEYACVAIVNDITDHKRDQKILKGAIERFSKAFELGPHMMTIIRKSDYRYVDVNRRFLESKGFLREEVIGKTPIEIGVPEDEFKETIETLEAHGSVQNYEGTLIRKCGPKGTVIVSAEKIQIDDQECILFAYNDVTEMKRMQTEQKLSQEKLLKHQEEMASILESMTDCFFAVDSNWRFTYINRAGEIAFGKSHDELLGEKITNVFGVNDAALRRYQEVVNEKSSVAFEVISETLGNKWLEINAFPTETGLTCYFRDITSRKVSEKEFARLDRLNLVGQLAAGIGHEIRNPMTTVRGYLQLLGEKPNYAAQKSTFELMISELDRANAIITEFLSLAQTKQTELKSQNLNDILYNLYPLLESDTFTQNKQIKFIPGKIPDLKLNGKEISQLFLNLTRNGLEAMEERSCLTVRSYVEDGKVVLAIEDEGSGILPENMRKVGTPFFTTKDNGTGLGLATCYKIAEAHNAQINIESSSKGTTFFIVFPNPDEDEEQNEIPPPLNDFYSKPSNCIL